jgi:c(7)-type cytochrome triheme protein
MRILLSCLAAIGFLSTFGVFAQGDKESAPKLVFKSKKGDVTFDHAAHIMRAKGDCKTCHDSLFKQDATAKLNFKANVHKTAEKNMTSCGSCHRAGGTAFESKGNCNNCHVN